MGDDKPKDGIGLKFVKYLGFGGILIGLSVFQIEFDFGVPQFRQVFEPMLIAAAGAFGLVAARIMLGRGAAIIAALFAIALRGLVALMVGPVLGAPINWFALYLGAAIVDRTARADAAVQAPDRLRPRQRPAGQHRRAVAGVVLDRRGLPLPVAVEHLARSADDGRAGRDPHRRAAARCSAWCSPISGCRPAPSASAWSR